MDSHSHTHNNHIHPHNSNSISRNSPGPTGNGNGKRRKVDGEKGMDSKKRSVSCDVCRARKVKCVKPEGAARCEGCVSLDQHCTYTHERKKPGPANRLVVDFGLIQSEAHPTDVQLCSESVFTVDRLLCLVGSDSISNSRTK
jgi:hypothetical protein